MIAKSVIKGILTYFPAYKKYKSNANRITHSSSDPEFCYTFWLGLLKYLKSIDNSIRLARICELGTGGSLGVGLSALLSGTDTYYALEIENTINIEDNLRILQAISQFFDDEQAVAPRYSQINLPIKDFLFPRDILKNTWRDPRRVKDLENELRDILIKSNDATGDRMLNLALPWQDSSIQDIDFVFSRAVMEHVANPKDVYNRLHGLLKPGGYMFHDIELHSHGITRRPYDHYTIHPSVWKLIEGNREYSLNRLTLDDHLDLISQQFRVVDVTVNKRVYSKNSISYLRGATILAQKPLTGKA